MDNVVENNFKQPEDIWSNFASFLTELIAKHADELDFDSWPDPHHTIMLQQLKDLYCKYLICARKKRLETDAKKSIENIVEICYSPYKQTKAEEENLNDDQRENVSDYERTADDTVSFVKTDWDITEND